MKTNSVTRRDPMNEVLPFEYLRVANFLVKEGQNERYWAEVKVPKPVLGRVRFEVARQVATFAIPLSGMVGAYLTYGLLGLLLAIPVAGLLGYLLDRQLVNAITKQTYIDRNIDRGRYRATKWLGERLGMKPEEFTLDIINKMFKDYVIILLLVEKEKARRAAARKAVQVAEAMNRAKYRRRDTFEANNTRPYNTFGGPKWVDYDDQDYPSAPSYPAVNPASGLPMCPNTFIDVGGNAFGTDSSNL